MSRLTPRTICLMSLLIGAPSLGGCNSSLIAQGAGIGAVTGGAAGAAISLLTGGNGRATAIAAGLGAAGGAAVGAAVGYGMQQQQQSFASSEDELAQRTAEAAQAAQAQRAEAAEARKSATQLGRGLDSLVRQASTGQALSAAQQRQLNAARQERQRFQQAVARGEQQARAIRQQAAELRGKGQDTRQLEAQAVSIEQSNREIADRLNEDFGALGRIDI